MVEGPLETVSVTVDPSPPGSGRPGAPDDDVARLVALDIAALPAKLGAWSCAVAWSTSRPMTEGTATWRGPLGR